GWTWYERPHDDRFAESGRGADDLRAERAHRGLEVGAAVLRGRGPRARASERRRTTPVPTRRDPARVVHPGRPAGRPQPPRDPTGAHVASRRTGADDPRLGAALGGLAPSARRTDRAARTPARSARLLHRLWLPLARELSPDEPGRRAA